MFLSGLVHVGYDGKCMNNVATAIEKVEILFVMLHRSMVYLISLFMTTRQE